MITLEAVSATAAEDEDPKDGITAAAVSVSETAKAAVVITTTAAEEKKDNDPAASSIV